MSKEGMCKRLKEKGRRLKAKNQYVIIREMADGVLATPSNTLVSCNPPLLHGSYLARLSQPQTLKQGFQP
jgi:hypothetical protein